MFTGENAGALKTERLLLRRWRESDHEPFAAMNADPVVMEHFPAPLSREESDRMIERIEAGFEQHGFGLWAVEVLDSDEFAGFVGLSVPSFEAPFMPAVEVGWRLARKHWGHGYATEAAQAALRHGFERAGLAEIVSFTVPANRRSTHVMERIGMTPGGEFEHPRLPPGHPLRRHLLYRITRDAWASEGLATGSR